MNTSVFKTLGMFFLVLVLVGCNSNNTKKTTKSNDSVEMNHGMPMNWRNEIMLDGERKWMANSETTHGVNDMLQRISEDQSVSVDAYRSLASDLNKFKNTIVEKCTMEGPSHDNLHIWLYPLMDELKNLSEVQTTEQGEEITMHIKDHLQAYFTYFQ